MPEATVATFDLANASPGELEQRRREIVSSLTTKYTGYDDPEVPIELLQELAAITANLRRKTSGPPKVAKKSNGSKLPTTLDDLAI
jgi:hypothetical protein